MKTNCSFRDVYDSEGARSWVILEVWGIQIDTLLSQIISNADSPEERALFSAFETAGGHSACTSSLVRCLDQVWYLEGATAPIILRRLGNSYTIISAAVLMLNDRMEGMVQSQQQQMADLVEKGRKHRKQISIV